MSMSNATLQAHFIVSAFCLNFISLFVLFIQLPLILPKVCTYFIHSNSPHGGRPDFWLYPFRYRADSGPAPGGQLSVHA